MTCGAFPPVGGNFGNQKHSNITTHANAAVVVQAAAAAAPGVSIVATLPVAFNFQNLPTNVLDHHNFLIIQQRS